MQRFRRALSFKEKDSSPHDDHSASDDPQEPSLPAPDDSQKPSRPAPDDPQKPNSPQLGPPTADSVDRLLIPRENKLLAFRSLVGIDNSPILIKGKYARKISNTGIYASVVEAETTAKKDYTAYARLINGCLAFQLVVAAALTALGAANGPHGAVTLFGAINTVIAGILTYLKASGLPHRKKDIEQQWRAVREHIEQLEREYLLQRCPNIVEEDVRGIVEMYEDVRQSLKSDNSESKAPKNAKNQTSPGNGHDMEGRGVHGMAGRDSGSPNPLGHTDDDLEAGRQHRPVSPYHTDGGTRSSPLPTIRTPFQ